MTKTKRSRGKRGAKGERGAPGIAPQELRALIRNMEGIQADAAIQFLRIAQMQVQIDETLKALKQLGERAGRQHKQRRK
jgi:hypothetical protein